MRRKKSNGEKVFNLFLYITDDLIHELGATPHFRSGTDDQKTAYLQGEVGNDYKYAKRFPIPEWCIAIRDGKTLKGWLPYDTYVVAASVGKHFEIIEHIFQHLGACDTPLMVITPIVNGKPRVDAVTDVYGREK